MKRGHSIKGFRISKDTFSYIDLWESSIINRLYKSLSISKNSKDRSITEYLISYFEKSRRLKMSKK